MACFQWLEKLREMNQSILWCHLNLNTLSPILNLLIWLLRMFQSVLLGIPQRDSRTLQFKIPRKQPRFPCRPTLEATPNSCPFLCFNSICAVKETRAVSKLNPHFHSSREILSSITNTQRLFSFASQLKVLLATNYDSKARTANSMLTLRLTESGWPSSLTVTSKER